MRDQKRKIVRLIICIALIVIVIVGMALLGSGSLSKTTADDKANTEDTKKAANDTADADVKEEEPSGSAADKETEKADETEEAVIDDPADFRFNSEGDEVEITGYDTTANGRKIVIPDSIDGHTVTSIGENAFKSSNAVSITIPETVTAIKNRAFDKCGELTSITLPDSVKTIGIGAFSQCKNLTSVTLPEGIESIDQRIFTSCKKLTDITIPDSVKTIGDFSFSDCSSLASITIPDQVESIGKQAFKSCTSLVSVVIPESVVSISKDAFKGCDNLTVTVTEGSYAETFCKENEIAFEYGN